MELKSEDIKWVPMDGNQLGTIGDYQIILSFYERTTQVNWLISLRTSHWMLSSSQANDKTTWSRQDAIEQALKYINEHKSNSK